jgi:hypothetical protein
MVSSSAQQNGSVHRISFRAQNTRKNFRDDGARKRGESNFLRAFERAYLENSGTASIAAGEFGLAGYGIADLIWIAWKPDGIGEDFTACALEKQLKRRQLFAFEAKLKDWRKALQQAFRYRYFADKAIVVLPTENSFAAKTHIETFKQFDIGLWTFNRSTGRIYKCFTPSGVSAINREAREKAIALISSKVNLSKLREQFESAL